MSRGGYRPLTDHEIKETSLRQLQLSYQSLRREYEDVRLQLERTRYRYEGPNGTPRPKNDVSPNSPLQASIGERIKKP